VLRGGSPFGTVSRESCSIYAIVVRNPQSVNVGKRRIGMQQARNGYEQTGVVEFRKEIEWGGGGAGLERTRLRRGLENNREFQD
jgi:hypothetical protein